MSLARVPENPGRDGGFTPNNQRLKMQSIELSAYQLAFKLQWTTADQLERCRAICRLGRRLRKLSEFACDFGWTDANEVKALKIKAKLMELTTIPGLRGVAIQGDPRGYTVRVLTHDKRRDTWADDGLFVPGS